MQYARFESLENMEKLIPLDTVDLKNAAKITGIPMGYDKDKLYIDSRVVNSLVIGGNNSGKTNLITLPMLHLSAIAEESTIVCPKGKDVYDVTSKMYEENGYNVVKIDFDNLKESSKWNPLEFPFKVYKEGNKDLAQDLVENVAFYLLGEKYNPNQDPFWVNSAINYFTGITLYTFENKDYVTLLDVMDINKKVADNPKDFLLNLDKNSNIYINLFGILSAPPETMGSILAVFTQKMKMFISKEGLNKMMEKSDFDITRISEQKTIVYLMREESSVGNYLMPLFINQVYFAKKDSNKLSVILEDFANFNPISNFSRILDNSRMKGIKFTIIVRSFRDLYTTYGNDQVEIFKLLFSNIIYLMSADNSTLEIISDMCGNKNEDNKVTPLITVEQLRTLPMNEVVIISQRMMPYKGKLLSYYEFSKNN